VEKAVAIVFILLGIALSVLLILRKMEVVPIWR
jgi:F0F1-type ATP synthase assembly protein I